MSAKVQVIGENRAIKRTLALTLVLKQVYDWHVYMISVKARPVSDQLTTRGRHIPKFRGPHVYEHHIEPKIVPLSIANSAWMRYVEGL